MLCFRQPCEINKQRIKSTQKQQLFSNTCCKLLKTLFANKIAANYPTFNNTKNLRVTVNG